MQERTSRKEREDQIEQGRPPLTEYDAELGHTYGKPDDGMEDPVQEDRSAPLGRNRGNVKESEKDSWKGPEIRG